MPQPSPEASRGTAHEAPAAGHADEPAGSGLGTVGIVIFDGFEELDVVGPYEVLTAAVALGGADGEQVLLIAPTDAPVRGAKGMRILADVTVDDAPHLDVLLVPGGMGTRREVDNPDLLAWLAQRAADARWVTSVCTGALLYAAAGVSTGREVTTYHQMIEPMRARFPDVVVHADRRWVVDGNLVSSAGVSAGIDMSLWLVGQTRSPAFARTVQAAIEYDPAPPYADL